MKDNIKKLVGEVGKAAIMCVVSYAIPKVGDKLIEQLEAKKSDPGATRPDTFRS